MLVFALGGGMSIVTGAMHLSNPAPPENPGGSYAVLACAAVFEGVSWVYGFKAFHAERRGRGILETIHLTKNPATFAVLLEDSAALAGLVLAFLGIYLSGVPGSAWLDGASSILIGLLQGQRIGHQSDLPQASAHHRRRSVGRSRRPGGRDGDGRAAVRGNRRARWRFGRSRGRSVAGGHQRQQSDRSEERRQQDQRVEAAGQPLTHGASCG